MDSIKNKIIARLPICHDCINCKIIWWSGKSEQKHSLQVTKTEIDGEKLFYSLRCSWLKTTMNDPENIGGCDGKQTSRPEKNNRD